MKNLYSMAKSNFCIKTNKSRSLKLCDLDNCQYCFNRSFASCEKSVYWNLESNNNISPRHVFKKANKKYFFNCPKCEHIFDTYPDSIFKGGWCGYCNYDRLCDDDNCEFCFDKSFASHSKAVYWGSQNKLSARQVCKMCNKKYLFDCPDCKHTFGAQICHIARGEWCSYCVGNLLCNDKKCQFCFDKSFASQLQSQYWSSQNKFSPRQVTYCSGQYAFFDCNICGHTFQSRICNITYGTWCGYCASKILCDNSDCNFCYTHSFASHPKSEFWNSSNKNLPRTYHLSSRYKAVFNCDKCRRKFSMVLNKVVQGQWCPFCFNKTEGILFDWLKTVYSDTICQAKFDWCKNVKTSQCRRYDFYIPSIDTIIELDGAQHFLQVSNWNSPDDIFVRDVYKTKKAIIHNISVIRILQEDVFRNTYNWKKYLKEIFDKISDTTIPKLYTNPKDECYEKLHQQCKIKYKVVIDE